MGAGYIIVGTLWAVCAGGLLVAGATSNVAAAAVIGFVGATILTPPTALVAGGLTRLTRAVRARIAHHPERCGL